jgi:hypothetical protein
MRSKFNAIWVKDRGKNPDGSERRSGLQYAGAANEATCQGRLT